jgi:hypothetical protein
MHVAASFTPAFKYLQKNSLIVFERGRKARGYVHYLDTPIGAVYARRQIHQPG